MSGVEKLSRLYVARPLDARRSSKRFVVRTVTMVSTEFGSSTSTTGGEPRTERPDLLSSDVLEDSYRYI
jgi:hypothetical protein